MTASYPLQDFLKATQGRLVLGQPNERVPGISIDTRSLQKGDLFFAIPGRHHDGHDHVGMAVDKGASGLLVEKLDERLAFDRGRPPFIVQVSNSVLALQSWARFLRQKSGATVVGITGSNGKTTTKEMVASILRQVGPTLATRGNLNNQLGLPLTLAQSQTDHRFLVLEMGASRPGDISLLADIGKPTIGVITNVGKAHLQGLGTPDGVLKEKRALLDAIPSDGTVVINQDDPLLAGIANSLAGRKLFFGMTALADVRAEAVHEEDLGIQFTLNVKGQRVPIQLSVPGRFQVMNALAAAAVGVAAGATLEQIAKGLNSFRPVAMRMQLLPHSSGTLLINDAYNANPSSVRASVKSFCQSYLQRSRWLVLGDMRELGTDARSEHRELGLWLSRQPLHKVFLYGRDTRFVLESMTTQNSPIQVKRFRKKRTLLTELEQGLPTKPVILFKASRSMKLEDIVASLVSAPSPH